MKPVVAIAVIAAAVATPASALTRSWQQQWSTGDFSEVRALDADRRRVFVAARGGSFDVRALAPRTGELLWRNDEAEATPGSAAVVRYATGTVWAGGSIATPDGGADWCVRAIDPATGATTWQDSFDFRGLGDGVSAVDVAAGRLIAAGTVTSHLRFGGEWLVRAYDTASGALLSQDLRATGGNDSADHAVADGDGVWVAGVLAPDTLSHVAVRAYDATTGAARWSRRIDDADGFPTGISRLGARLAVIGELGGQWLVIVYDDATGRRLWSHVDADALQPGGVIGARGAFIVTGTAFDADGYDMLTRAYDAATGAILWEDRMSRPGSTVHGRAITARGGLVVAAGTIYGVPPLGAAAWARALDLADGSLRWEYGYDAPSDDESTAVLMLRGRLVIGGLLRPFEATSGAQLLGYRAPRVEAAKDQP